MKTPGSPQVTVYYFGDSGGSTQYYYWVQAAYTWGYGNISASALATVLSLSHSNVVQVNWNPMPFAVAYTIYRTTTNVAPTGTGAFAIAVDVPVHSGGFVDNGLPLITLTVPAGAVNITLADDAPKDRETETAPEKSAKEIAEEQQVFFDKQAVAQLKQLSEQVAASLKTAQEKEKKDEDQFKKDFPPPPPPPAPTKPQVPAQR